MKSGARGLYSEAAIRSGSSTVWYLMADGTERELTAVDRPEVYRFDDAEDRGTPVRWIRDGKPGRLLTLPTPPE